MAMMGSAGWNAQDQTLPSGSDDDFQQFLDMQGMGNMGDGLNFDFQPFQDPSATGLLPHSRREQLDTPMGGTDSSAMIPRTTGLVPDQMQAITTAPGQMGIPSQMVHPPATPTDAISEIDAQIQYLQQQRIQQQQRQMHEQQAAYYAPQTHAVPPTPQSLEMHPNSQFFSPTDPQAFDNRIHRMKDSQQQDMAFTPLVSPAVTPLDPQFNVDAAFSGPTYFSPLASPALHAQGDGANVFSQQQPGGKANSPIELEVDAAMRSSSSNQDLSKKARKNNAAKASRKASVRQSPISKPQRRKTAPSSAIVAQALSEAVETTAGVGEKGQQRASSDSNTRVEDSEENASVSPEALSDMPPPPVPPPRPGKSPLVRGEMSSPAQRPTMPMQIPKKPSPATPASLMKLPASSNTGKSATPSPNHHGQMSPDAIDSFQLPESATGFADAHFSPPDAQMRSPSDHAPAGKNASFQALPSPIFAKPSTAASASQSPQLAPGSTTPSHRRTPQLAARGSKKRTSSVSVSPALRPKISPNIKPLLPGTPGISAEDTASKLLASKSNYQNILEGNQVPGVSYPSELSTNLTSKRTSHKIAEQGRRNRINSALQEIAALLPKSSAQEGKGSDNGEEAGKKDDKGNTPSSKASTVEMAIEYIKQLRQEVAEANRRAEEAEKRLGINNAD